MATDRPLLRRRRLFASALESTTGEAVALAQAQAEYNFYNYDIAPDVNMVAREAQGSMGQLGDIPGARMATITGFTYLHGNFGSGLPYWATTLLAASGWTASGATYSPDSGPTATVTAGVYADGNVQRVSGTMFNWTMTFNPGQPVRCDWSGVGKLLEPQAATLISRTTIGGNEPRWSAGTVTIGGAAVKLSELVISANNEVVMREDANADDDPARSGDGTGYHAATITNRNIEITMDVETQPHSTKNWAQDLLDGDIAALSVVVGSDANNTITIAAPALYVKNDQPGDRNGIMVDNLTFGCATNSVGGDDELTIAFS